MFGLSSNRNQTTNQIIPINLYFNRFNCVLLYYYIICFKSVKKNRTPAADTGSVTESDSAARGNFPAAVWLHWYNNSLNSVGLLINKTFGLH